MAELSVINPWRPQAGPQEEAVKLAIINELFYGGAVFGGKSDFLLGDFAQDVPRYGSAWHGILFRESYPQLEELIKRAKEIYPAWFGVSINDIWYSQEKTFKFPNGSTLKMRFAEGDDDWMEYSGASFGWIGWDELPLMRSPNNYLKLKARLRSAGTEIPVKRIRATGNPGGPLHKWVKDYFRISEYPLGRVVFKQDGMTRMFLRSRLEDNALGLKNDPAYEERLMGLGSPELVRAWRDGDWEIVQGAYFPEFVASKHVIEPFEIPSRWLRFRAMDWGSSSPFCVHWFAVSDGTVPGIPREAVVLYREWYGADKKKFNTGLKMQAEAVGAQIADLESLDGKITYGVLDPSAFRHDSGPSIAEKLGVGGADFHPADNTRIGTKGAMGGWDEVRARLNGDIEMVDGTPRVVGPPMLYIFSTCTTIIRTLPAMQHDPKKPEDMDTRGEDHAPDTLRYGLMSRPWVKGAKVERVPFSTGRDASGRVIPIYSQGRGFKARQINSVGGLFETVRKNIRKKDSFEDLWR